MKAMVSACLLGVLCKYNGGSNKNETVINLLKDYEVISVCPEVMGGLPIPRLPSEILGGRVVTKNGEDVTEFFERGAERCLALAREEHPDLILLQSRSPSCGVRQRYDGSFHGNLVDAPGMTAALLIQNGFMPVDVSDLPLEQGDPQDNQSTSFDRDHFSG